MHELSSHADYFLAFLKKPNFFAVKAIKLINNLIDFAIDSINLP